LKQEADREEEKRKKKKKREKKKGEDGGGREASPLYQLVLHPPQAVWLARLLHSNIGRVWLILKKFS